MAKQRMGTTKLGIALAVLLCLMLIWAAFLVREKLLSNADRMGESLAETYVMEEENRFASYRDFLRIAADYVDDLIEAGATNQQVQLWMEGYLETLGKTSLTADLELYAVIDGQIVAAQPWDSSSSYDYSETEWYQSALARGERLTYTDRYTDAVTGEEIITLTTTLSGEGNVIAFDIALDGLHSQRAESSLPEGSSHFLFDRQGNLLFSASELDLSSEHVQSYLEQLRSVITEDTQGTVTLRVTGADGDARNAYCSKLQNGWTSVITMPVSSILQDNWDPVLLGIVAMFALLLAITVGFLVRSAVENRRARHTTETLQLLGDTYYAIYRVNYQMGTYEAIKSSPDVRGQLGDNGKTGDYQHLIDVVKEYVDERTYAEFERGFSIDNIRALVAEGVSEFGGDFRRRFPDGYKWVSIRIVHNPEFRLNEVIMCYREIDREKRRELQRKELLESALGAARQTAERKTAYFSNASHDMRTPLNAIVGLTELAKRDAGDAEKTGAYLQKIETAGNQLLALIDDVLDMSRLEHGDAGMLNYAPMSLGRCLDSTVDLFREQAEREGKHLTLAVDVETEYVYGDAKRLGQILNNLVSNALKYSQEGARIAVSLSQIDRNDRMAKYQLDVADTGVGMSEVFLDQVFEPFARETMFQPTGVTGTGLGMPIVKSLVQQMSGEITVRSKLGEGTTFTIVVPFQAAERAVEAADGGRANKAGAASIPDAETTEQAGVPEQAGASTAAGDSAAAPLSGKTVLVAEDNDINMLIAREYLALLGASVLEARNGREAVEAFSSSDLEAIDAVLMDMQMPEMDGCEAARAIRALDRDDAKRVVIVAATANAFAEDIAKTTEAGMNSHIAKPFTIEELGGALAALLD